MRTKDLNAIGVRGGGAGGTVPPKKIGSEKFGEKAVKIRAKCGQNLSKKWRGKKETKEKKSCKFTGKERKIYKII